MMKWLRFLGREREQDRDKSAPGPAEIAAGETVEMPAPARSPRKTKEKVTDSKGANPYDSSSWESDPVKGLRRVEDARTVRRNRGAGDPSDPYNTGGFRKGW